MGPDQISKEQPADAGTLAPGELLVDRYRIDEQLGSGGYGEVLAAEDITNGRRVAIKILHADAAGRDPAALARMRQEAEILEAVDHPNIVEVFDVGDSEHGEFIVMELLEGHSLEYLIEAEGPADPDRAAPVVEQLLSALDAAHQKQVLHRDLKPENILLIADDDEPTGEKAKLVDFGIAKAQELLDDDPDEGITLVKTRGGGFVGTPRYCSPEAAVGDPAGPSADLFSLGLVVAEWLTATARIDGEKQNVVLSVLIQPEPLDVSDCPADWQPWLARMIAKTPEQRYESAQQALQAFQALVKSEGDDVDMAQTIEQGAPSAAFVFGDTDISDTAETRVRTQPSAEDLAQQRDAPSSTNPAATGPSAAADPSADPSAGEEPDSERLSIGRFLAVAAVSCIVVLLLLMLVRTLT
ncbi:MAG: serine/threonine-protein kinase [Persicimonas sp.]